jgi:hypothetical protein
LGEHFSPLLKTAIDFQEQGFNVHVVVDGSSSRSMVDRFVRTSYIKIIKAKSVILIFYTPQNVSHSLLLIRMYAYKQLERAGINLTTSECAMLGLVGDSAHEKFKAVQKIIKESAPDKDSSAIISDGFYDEP